MQGALAYIGVFVVSFLLGSVPWGLVISKVFYNKDLRNEGSGNIGTTNAIRALGKIGGYGVFVLDFAKGLLSGFLATTFASMLGMDVHGTQIMQMLAFAGCIWGHVFSPWLGFKGGKGSAVAVGCLVTTFGPLTAWLELALFAVLVVATKYVSVGSIAAAAINPVFALVVYWGNPVAIAFAWAAAITIVWAHRGNIQRLRSGTESKIGKKK
ncbi:MAG: glycerol-3-phosphate acyltransferase [Eggerthellaceae bacterium]|nr:glycerol-3-phosphate acyltransferase [Eggerthellaceae bacterium]